VGFLRLILEAFAGSLLNVLAEALKDWRAATAQRDLGAAQQKQADTEAARQAQDDANVIALEPRDRTKTLKRLRDGEF
jgi:hypothetical protein